ncbi:MAG: serine/threonine protein kinase [Cyanobacteria bacterium HKST-UBA02]|nr:serine/threonine protein kinase [Cyanobacteria bacterium HKST-UBA02]
MRDLAAHSVYLKAEPSLPSRYVDRQTIGEGGTCVVVKARDSFLDRPVAIKYMKAELSNLSSVRRFQHEARIMSTFNHKHLPLVLDFGLSHCGRPYMVMELMEGRSLKELIAARGALEPELAVEVILQVLAALEHCHEKGIVHRDLKTDNIMICDQAERPLVKVVDFGLARGDVLDLTRKGSIIGTPLYMSPEQARGESADHRSDIYSLGCVLHEMLTGSPPFGESSAVATISAHVNASPPSIKRALKVGPVLADKLDAVIARMLDKDPSQRQQSAGEVIAELASLSAASRDDEQAMLKHLLREVELAETRQTSRGMSSRTILKALIDLEACQSPPAEEATGERPGNPFFCMTRLLQGFCRFFMILIVVSILLWPGQRPESRHASAIGRAGESADPTRAAQSRDQGNPSRDLWDIAYRASFQVNGTKAFASPQFCDADFEKLKEFPGVEYLNLVICTIDGSGLASLVDSNIDTLDLRGQNLAMAGFTNLARIKSLESLRLDRCPYLAPSKLAKLKKAPNLKHLNLSATNLSRQAQQEIAGIKGLTMLIVDGAGGIDDESLAIFAGMPNLKKLQVGESSQVTARAIARFRSEHPDITIN